MKKPNKNTEIDGAALDILTRRLPGSDDWREAAENANAATLEAAAAQESDPRTRQSLLDLAGAVRGEPARAGVVEGQSTALAVAEPDEPGAMMALDAMDLLKMVGRIEMAEFLATVAEKAIAETYLKIKQNKAWREFESKKPGEKRRRVATFEEFCEGYLGRSARRCRELVANYHLLGPDLYERAESIGLGQRDYNAIKALPADDQAIIKSAIETEDRSQVISLLQEMAIQHGKQLEASAKDKKLLTQRADAAETKLQASRSRVDKLLKENFDLEEKVEMKKLSPPAPDEEAKKLRGALMDFMMDNQRAAVISAVRSHVKFLLEHGDAHGVDHRQFVSGLFVEVEREYQILRHDFDIPSAPSTDLVPEWMGDLSTGFPPESGS